MAWQMYCIQNAENPEAKKSWEELTDSEREVCLQAIEDYEEHFEEDIESGDLEGDELYDNNGNYIGEGNG